MCQAQAGDRVALQHDCDLSLACMNVTCGLPDASTMHRGSGCASTRMSRPWPRQIPALLPRSRTDQWRSTTWSCLPQVCHVSFALLCRSRVPSCVVSGVPSCACLAPAWCPQLCIQHARWCILPLLCGGSSRTRALWCRVGRLGAELLLAAALCLHAVSFALFLLCTTWVRDGRGRAEAAHLDAEL